ncbi:MAG: twin-arginine translocase subunit TatB [Desulfobulbus propionicus]|nr:MAG: twin-arginine translocase subunit TatB [Desulfobulbus propionicus]
MFGIGFPEMIVICAVALIVVGPDKLPDLARSLAKGVMEMKKAMHQLKENFAEENEALHELQQELTDASRDLRQHMLDSETRQSPLSRQPQVAGSSSALETTSQEEVIELRPWEEDAYSRSGQQEGEDTDKISQESFSRLEQPPGSSSRPKKDGIRQDENQ